MGGILEAIGAVVLGTVGIFVGICEGFFKSFTSYFKGLSYSLNKGYSLKSKREFCEPAKEKYFFYKQYEDFNNTYKSACSVNTGNILLLKQQLKKGEFFTYGRVKAAQAVIYVIGNIINGLFCIIHFLIVTFITVPGDIAYFIVKAIEKIKFTRGKISGVCYHCHAKFEIPYYICPECGRVHKKLVPGPYGLIKRVCSCGKVIPTTNLAGRYRLRAICPACSKELETKESSPICIPVIGGVSAGKTSFVYAVLSALINDISKEKKWNIRFLNREQEERTEKLLDLINKGTPPRKTIKTGIVPYNLFINSDKFSSEKLLYIYDIAGEYFDIRADIRRQNYYKYSNGLIFIIDPLSMEAASENGTNLEDLVDRFILGFREVREMELNKLIDIPIAIIVNKMDLINNEGNILEFLKEAGEEKIIRKFEYNFSNYKFFSCSTLLASNIKKYSEEEGVSTIVKWILAEANKDMK